MAHSVDILSFHFCPSWASLAASATVMLNVRVPVLVYTVYPSLILFL